MKNYSSPVQQEGQRFSFGTPVDSSISSGRRNAREVEPFSDIFRHLTVFFSVGIGIESDGFAVRLLAFQFSNDTVFDF